METWFTCDGTLEPAATTTEAFKRLLPRPVREVVAYAAERLQGRYVRLHLAHSSDGAYSTARVFDQSRFGDVALLAAGFAAGHIAGRAAWAAAMRQLLIVEGTRDKARSPAADTGRGAHVRFDSGRAPWETRDASRERAPSFGDTASSGVSRAASRERSWRGEPGGEARGAYTDRRFGWRDSRPPDTRAPAHHVERRGDDRRARDTRDADRGRFDNRAREPSAERDTSSDRRPYGYDGRSRDNGGRDNGGPRRTSSASETGAPSSARAAPPRSVDPAQLTSAGASRRASSSGSSRTAPVARSGVAAAVSRVDESGRSGAQGDVPAAREP